jgi:hypothetical protein
MASAGYGCNCTSIGRTGYFTCCLKGGLEFGPRLSASPIPPTWLIRMAPPGVNAPGYSGPLLPPRALVRHLAAVVARRRGEMSRMLRQVRLHLADEHIVVRMVWMNMHLPVRVRVWQLGVDPLSRAGILVGRKVCHWVTALSLENTPAAQLRWNVQ